MLPQDVLHIALSELEALDVPRALSVAMLLKARQVDEIGNLPLDPLHYRSSMDYFAAAQATALLKKSELLADANGEVLEARARAQWLECEAACFQTNRFLYRYINGFQLDDVRVARFISTARRKMRGILGLAPNPMKLSPRFGPGATMSDPSTQSTVPDKMSSQVTLTDDALPYLIPFAKTAWGRAEQSRKFDMLITRGNTFFTVPKDFSKRRTCAKEPSLNVTYQLALGRELRNRLLKTGIDLERAQAIHQGLARSASLDGSYATIDLSNASDCIAEGLVKALMPPDWYELLDRCRCKFTKVDGKWHRLEKYSSMGNGFTFELETLIFLVLILTVDPSLRAGENVWVNGDDIIVPTEFGRAVLGCLRMFGLSPNWNKSFLTGPFRESCGGDFFLGKDVRPFYWKKDINEPSRLISLANGFRRAYQKCQDPDRADRLRRVWFSVLDRIPSHIRRCRGPEDLGDLVIHDEQSRWDARVKDSIRELRVFGPAEYTQVYLDWFHPDVTWAALLYGVKLSGSLRTDVLSRGQLTDDRLRFIVPRDGVTGYTTKWVPFS